MRLPALCLGLALCLISPAALAAPGDFPKVAGQVEKDLGQAQAEQKQTAADIAQRRAQLTQELAQLRARLAARKKTLQQTQEALEKANQRRRQLTQEVEARGGELNELAGHVRAAARDFLSLARHSPVSAEQPQRLAELQIYLDQENFPGLDQIKGLVEMHLGEMTATGQILSRQGKLVSAEGSEVQGRIVRVGGLGALYQAGDEMGYLTLGPQSARLLAAGGELPWGMKGKLAAYLEGQAPAAPLDVSGGAALQRMARRVSWQEHLLSGGPLIWPILAVALLALVLIAERLVFLGRVRANTDRLMGKVNQMVEQGDFDQARQEAADFQGRPTANVILAGLSQRGSPFEVIENALSEAMLRELPRLERFLTALKVLAAVAPLLGLLGTVTGMINTFHVITVFGTGDPRLMAGGISEALVTTQLGLAVAIPVLVAATLLARRAQRIASDMEEKATALAASLIRWSNGSVAAQEGAA